MPQVARFYPGAGKGWRRTVTTHCVHGHAYTPENTVWRDDGSRNCRECSRATARQYQQRRRANG